MPTYTAIDTETTGLNPSTDVIIEIGAVKFNSEGGQETWETLINPGRPIPPQITQLTGINNEMVRSAPSIGEVIPDLERFLGNSILIGHNIEFDLAFLQKHIDLSANKVIDTYELASVLLPSSSRYNLEALALSFGHEPESAHRALDDALTTQFLFTQLDEKCKQLPVPILAEIVRLSKDIKWHASYFFNQHFLKKRNENWAKKETREDFIYQKLFENDDISFDPMLPKETIEPLNVEEVCSTLDFGGEFSHYFKQFEHRDQQLEMVRTITSAFNESTHLMVEAGTGTGKSFAYLVPASLFALKNSQCVLISTNTLNLQDQLINKDIPDLKNALKLDNLRVQVLKGRSNYFCPRMFDALKKVGPSSSDEMRILAKILVWLSEGSKGNKNEINLNGPTENEIWYRISAENENCSMQNCLDKYGGLCPFYTARQKALSAHIVIVNHALLLVDIALGNKILPEYDYLIIDEGHHIESATTNALSYKISQGNVMRLFKELGSSNSGMLGILSRLIKIELSPSEYAAIDQLIHKITDLSFQTENEIKDLFKTFDYFMSEQREGRPINAYGQQQRIIPASRTIPLWEEIEIVWDNASAKMKTMINHLSQISQYILNNNNHLSDDLKNSMDIFGNFLKRIREAEDHLNNFILEPNNENIYWVSISPNVYQLSLQTAPLHIGSLMEKHMWLQKSCVILTSATLSTHEGFDYIKERLNAYESESALLGSPFDFENSALLYLVDDIPEPHQKVQYQNAVENTIINASVAAGGKTLVLFTSHAQLKKTANAIYPILKKHNIQLFEQGKGASRQTLLEDFKTSERAVLLGTKSFWEGVDVPGEALSILIITKLPFDVPSDPIIAARAETFDNPFNEYNLPEAVLRFRQGFGRLIRTQADRGVVIILDKRILTKSYGSAFLDAIPPCTRKKGSLQLVAKNITDWLNL